jgi:hypothetical protein
MKVEPSALAALVHYSAGFSKIMHIVGDVAYWLDRDDAAGLTNTEKRKFNNFLQEMKALKVLRSGDVQGEYVFNVRIARLYIWLQDLQREKVKV